MRKNLSSPRSFLPVLKLADSVKGSFKQRLNSLAQKDKLFSNINM